MSYRNVISFAEFAKSFDCEKCIYEVRKEIRSNDSIHYVEQCIKCGGKGQSLKSINVKEKDNVCLFDNELRLKNSHYWGNEKSIAYLEYKRLSEHSYNKYLESSDWQSKRKRVLERSNFTCEGCLINKATQVHHLTYVRLYHEMMFDLVAVCEHCHKEIHNL